MKKLFAILALVLGMVSCQTEPEGLDVVVGDEQEVMLSVSLPEGTRAASSTGFDFTNFEQNAKYDLRFILEISYNDNVIRNVKTSNTTSTTFPVRLAPNREYTFTVWADLVEEGSNADLYYNTAAGLDKIEVNTVKWTANTEARDAFTNSIKHEFKAPNKNFGITLYRPFAKVRVVATDIQEILNFQIIPTSAEVAYTTDIYTGFNAVTGDVISDKKESVSHSFAYAGDDAVDTYTDVEGERTLFTDYIFVPTAGSTIQFILDVKDASGTTIKQNNFNTTIPVAKNKVTTIKGHVLTDGGDLSVDIENGFDTPGTDIEVISGNKTEAMELTEGTYLFGDVTFNVADGAAIVVKAGNDVVIDLMGSMAINATQGINVEEGATLTINGISETRNANRGGKLVVKATNGSAISGSVTINNLASLTAIGNGDHAFGIGGTDAEVAINNTKVEYAAGGHIQPLFVNDTKYGKSEPEGGAAIGGKKVVIESSEIVKAEGGSKAAAIGNSFWNSTEVAIKDSELRDIFGGNASAAIGGSRYSNDKTTHHSVKVTIENSTITNSVGGQYGAGIGSGYDTHCLAGGEGSTAVNEITIENSTITAQGGQYAAGIGTGFHVAALSGSIDAASSINATAGAGFYKDTYTHAQNIGYGIVDPAREFANGVVTFTVANEVIDTPKMAVADGVAVNENEYAIYNVNGLKWLATTTNDGTTFANKTIKLMSDIDLKGEEWTPIGVGAKHFMGTFDGQGHTINGLKISQRPGASQAALFGTMSGHPVIKNFVIEGANVKYPKDNNDFYASAVAGTIYGFVTFENITVKNSTITGNNKVGAIFAHDGSSNKITINNCHVDNCYIASEHLTDGGNVGGLIGFYQTGSTEACKISNSSVKNSTIVGINSSNNGKRANSEFIGGILTKTNTNLVLENCVVENNDFTQTIDGTASVTYEGAFPAQFIGGDRNEQLLGFVVVNGVPVSTAGYEKLANYPNILVKEGNYYVFGVAGLEDLNNYFKANWCGNNTWTPEYNIAADIDATGFTWEGVYLNVGWNGNNGIVLNGNGHTISNLTINNYLLSGTPCGGNDGVRPGLVKDITMKNVTVNGSDHDAAIFWGNCFTNVDFENVTVDGAKIMGGSNVGALVSRTSIEGPNTEIKVNFKNCVVKNSTLEANNTNADPNGASGFIGRTYGNTKLTFEGCSVENNTINNANGLVGGAVYGYTTWYGDGFYGTGACDTFTNWNGLVIETVTTAEALKAALKAGKNVILGADIAMTESVAISNANFTLDGNGKTITMTESATNNIALLDITGGKATFKNVTFDGIKKGAVVRTVGAEFVADYVTTQNCNHTVDQGLFRLYGESTITNSTFKNNTCKMVVSFCFDHDTDSMGTCLYTLNIDGCEFAENTCSTTAVCYYANGSAATLNGNKFVNNTLTVSNGATVYLGFKKNCTVTNNLFDGNTVTATSKRSSGGLMVGNAAVVTGNAFVNNTVTVNGETGYGNDVCASPYYAPINLSGNYWGGDAPVENDDYYKEYNNYEVIINDYLTVNPFN